MTADDLKQLHPSDVVLWLHVEKAAWRLVCEAKADGIKVIRPTPKHLIQSTPSDSILWGRCHFDLKRNRKSGHSIEITVRPFILFRDRGNPKCGWSKTRSALHEIFDTICHEVAHAKAGWDADHGAAFARHYGKLILLAEKINIRRDILAAGIKIPP